MDCGAHHQVTFVILSAVAGSLPPCGCRMSQGVFTTVRKNSIEVGFNGIRGSFDFAASASLRACCYAQDDNANRVAFDAAPFKKCNTKKGEYAMKQCKN